MDSKDVEEIFKGVLTDESQESQESAVFPMVQNTPAPPVVQQQYNNNMMTNQQLNAGQIGVASTQRPGMAFSAGYQTDYNTGYVYVYVVRICYITSN